MKGSPQKRREVSLLPAFAVSWILNTMAGVSKMGNLGEIGVGQRPLTEIESELARFKQELPLALNGAGHLKKAAA